MERLPSPPARVLAGLGAVVVAAFFGVLSPAGLLERGYPYAAATLVVCTVPLVLFLALLALAPAALQRVLSRFTRLDLGDPGHVAAGVVMAGALYFVLGFGALVNGVYAIEAVTFHPGDAALGEVDAMGLAAGLLQNLVVLILPVLLYVSFVHGHGPLGALRAIGLRAEGAVPGLLLGFGAALLFLLGLMALSVLIAASGLTLPENERALAIAQSVTLAGALAIAVVSSVSEEIFFRGFLQPRIGLVAQAVVFALAHLSYANVLEVVVTFSLALVFGLMYRRTGSLWGPIGAHFLFNLVMLVLGIYADDLGMGGDAGPGNDTAAD
jgi:membrane protease YdiL (CAAX protease family)